MTDLLEVVEGHTGGDPMGRNRFVRRSLQAVSADLQLLGHAACANTVGRLLRGQDFALRVNVKRFTGPYHPERDRQFGYIRDQIDAFLDAGLPVLSIDTKKKELIGNFKNAGACWCRQAAEVNCHDFRQDAVCRAVPYGLYDVGVNRGYVCVGVSHETAAFAVAAVRRWWVRWGCKQYLLCPKVLLLADAGGANGARLRLWKKCLQEELADRYGLSVTVCHYPAGASKWNPVEHRLFGPISNNWAGVPLRSLELLMGYIRGTQTSGGLRVETWLNEAAYPTKVRVSDREMQELNLTRHEVCPQWNYTLKPRPHHLWN